jgi:hypothetical protein
MARSVTHDETLEAYCPHCFLLIESDVAPDWPPRATRCPHCRLLVGEGRAKDTPEANPGARGTAAGVFAHRAKRDQGEQASPEAVCEAIRTVATELGARPERLLMVDYQQHASADPSLPVLADVFAAFGSWKRARREAAAGA